MTKGALAILVHGGTENWSPARWKGRFDEMCRDRRVLLLPASGFDPAEVRVDEIMTKPLIVVNPSLRVELVARLFANHRIGHAPVIENHKLIGIVSLTDLVVEVITEPT